MKAKKIALIVAGAVLVFYLVTQPAAMAQNVNFILNWLKDAATAIVTFLKSVFGA